MTDDEALLFAAPDPEPVGGTVPLPRPALVEQRHVAGSGEHIVCPVMLFPSPAGEAELLAARLGLARRPRVSEGGCGDGHGDRADCHLAVSPTGGHISLHEPAAPHGVPVLPAREGVALAWAQHALGDGWAHLLVVETEMSPSYRTQTLGGHRYGQVLADIKVGRLWHGMARCVLRAGGWNDRGGS